MSINDYDLTLLIKYRLQRAKETFSDALILFEKGSFISSSNRLYYACFYAVLAYLLTIPASPKTHDGAKTMLGLYLVKTGLIDRDMASFYSNLLNLRISGDYDEFIEIDPEELYDMLKTGEEFIQIIETIITESQCS